MKKPKTLKLYCVNYFRTGYGKDDITMERFLENSVLYNEKGEIIRDEHYIAENELDSIIVNEYNEKEQLISNAHYGHDESLIQKNTFAYDEEENLICQNSYYGEGCDPYTSHFVYQNGLLQRQDAYENDQFISTEKEYTYNEEGLIAKLIEYDEDGKIQYITTNEYNDEKLLIRRVRDEIAEKDRRTYLFEYDEHQNKVKELIYDYDDVLISKSYFLFNEKNLMIEKEDEDLDNYQKIIYHYEGENVSKIETFDKEQKLLSWTEYSYDEYNLISKLKHYGIDETDENEYRIRIEYEYVRD